MMNTGPTSVTPEFTRPVGSVPFGLDTDRHPTARGRFGCHIPVSATWNLLLQVIGADPGAFERCPRASELAVHADTPFRAGECAPCAVFRSRRPDRC